ncbi:MAG: sugar porter family MFS transporter [Bacteroidales bacterium]
MKNSTINIKYVSFLAVVAAIGGFLFGYDTAVISGTVSQVAAQFGLDAMQTGWYVGCALLGSIIGVVFAGPMGDMLGRKITMILAALLFTASAIGCAVSTTYEMLVVFRIIGGVGIGVVSIVSPLYISEVSVTEYRGRLVSLYQVAITVGFLGAYLFNYVLLIFSEGMAQSFTNEWFHKIFATEIWRGMLGMETVPALLFFAIIFFIPESPRWLILKRRNESALGILKRIYGSLGEANNQLMQTKSVVSSEQKSEWKLLFKPGIRKAVLVGMAIAILGQFMGVNAVLYYGPTIFEESGLSSGDSLFFQVLVGAVNMGTAILALLIIDKIGRKKLVYYGVSGMIATLILIGTYFMVGKALGITAIALLIFILAYVFFCAVSICAVIWVLLSEMYPIKVRGVAMSIAGLSLWIGTYLIGQLTPWLLQNIMPANTFYLFAVMCVPYMYIIWKLVPDTTGKSLEEIEKMWEPTSEPVQNSQIIETKKI